MKAIASLSRTSVLAVSLTSAMMFGSSIAQATPGSTLNTNNQQGSHAVQPRSASDSGPQSQQSHNARQSDAPAPDNSSVEQSPAGQLVVIFAGIIGVLLAIAPLITQLMPHIQHLLPQR